MHLVGVHLAGMRLGLKKSLWRAMSDKIRGHGAVTARSRREKRRYRIRAESLACMHLGPLRSRCSATTTARPRQEHYTRRVVTPRVRIALFVTLFPSPSIRRTVACRS